jgi:hypothetical protein
MSEKPLVVKGALRFKSNNSNQKKTTVDLPPKNQVVSQEVTETVKE